MICYDLDNINYPVTIAFPTGLAKESKQDEQITTLADTLIQSERIENLLVNLLKEAKETNRSLKKILRY
jgi:hypothetical protein